MLRNAVDQRVFAISIQGSEQKEPKKWSNLFGDGEGGGGDGGGGWTVSYNFRT